jgi:beta-galactosidase/beta-glucuronidase
MMPWKPAASPLLTVFASDVSPNMTTAYPRPQMTRNSTSWTSLNGMWEFDHRVSNLDEPPFNSTLDFAILVPFPVESPLSGIRNLTKYNHMWYRQVFEPKSLGDCNGRTLLHIEACDWRTTVYVNGNEVGTHSGGYDPFSFDITEFLRESTDGDHEVVIGVYDPTEEGDSNAIGKQSRDAFSHPSGCFYAPTSGIWGTVWTECVPMEAYIQDLLIDTSDPTSGIEIQVSTVTEGKKIDDMLYLRAILKTGKDDGMSMIGEAKVPLYDTIYLMPPSKGFTRWTPDNPYLYSLTIEVLFHDTATSTRVVDTVDSYVGVRTITLGDRGDGVIAPLLNGDFVFQMATLDQGFSPDGNYAFATDEALAYDILVHKQMGFNAVRKHVKFEPRRWYYHTDRLGLLVWQDLPSRMSTEVGEDTFQEWSGEAARGISARRNAPSIIQWQTYNEGWGQNTIDPSFTEATVKLVSNLDPSRLVDDASGGRNVCPQGGDKWVGGCFGHVTDVHMYPQPDFRGSKGHNVTARDPKKALVLGEYGGTLFVPLGHEWSVGACHGYATVTSRTDLAALYNTYADQIVDLIDKFGLSAAVYTQITDVETECNGLLTYDRIFKVKPELIAASNAKVISHFKRRSSFTSQVKR